MYRMRYISQQSDLGCERSRGVAAVDFLDSAGALRAPRGRLPRTSARARSARRTRRGLRISRPRPALHRRGPVSSVVRASATAAAPASLSAFSDVISHRPRPHTPCPPRRSRRGLAHSPRGRAARPSPAARGAGRSAAAAANAPGFQCFRSHTTTAANAAIYDRRAPPHRANTTTLQRPSRRRRSAVSSKNWWRPRTYRPVDHTQSSRPAVPRAASCGANRRRLPVSGSVAH